MRIFHLREGGVGLIAISPFVHLPLRSRITPHTPKVRSGRVTFYLLVGEGLMAYQDSLFQLGMDLTRSSTAQEEDRGDTARSVRSVGPASDYRSGVGRFEDRDGAGIAGSHLIVDLFGACRLDDTEHIEGSLRRCAEVAGATFLRAHLDRCSSTGDVSGFAVVDRGHISIHTHPGTGFAALDVFLRGDAKIIRCVDVLEKAFSADRVVFKQHQRGDARTGVQQAATLRASPRSKVRKAA